MKKINVVGLGPGNIKYMSTLGIKSIESCEILVGSQRQIDDVLEFVKDQEIYVLKKLADLMDFLKENSDKQITIIVSGDTGFYSMVPYLKRFFKVEELNIIPSISSYQYLFSKIGENWQNYQLASVHGREFDILKALKREEIEGLILLTDNINNPFFIAENLYNSGVRGLEIVVGESLSYDDEVITKLNIEDFKTLDRDFKMNVMVLKKGENYAYL